MTGFAAALLVALVAGAALTWIGVETVRDSTTGRTVASSDPSEPGFEGFLEPTPTLLVAHQSGEELRSLALPSLSSHRSEEHTSELQSLMRSSYAVFCLKKKMTAYTTTQKNE